MGARTNMGWAWTEMPGDTDHRENFGGGRGANFQLKKKNKKNDRNTNWEKLKQPTGPLLAECLLGSKRNEVLPALTQFSLSFRLQVCLGKRIRYRYPKHDVGKRVEPVPF